MNSIKSTTKRKSGFKKALIILLISLVLATGVGAAMYALKVGPFTETPPVQQESESSQKKDSSSDSSATDIKDQKIDDPTSNSIKNQEGDTSSSDNDNNGMQITSALVSGDTFRIRTLIPSITSAGTCSLTMSKSGSTSYNASAGVQPMASSSTCKGFDIPLASLSSGTWKISVIYTNGDVSSSATKEVVINA